MLTAHEAGDLARQMRTAPPLVKRIITAQLINYYKELLTSNKKQPVPAVRRMWQ